MGPVEPDLIVDDDGESLGSISPLALAAGAADVGEPVDDAPQGFLQFVDVAVVCPLQVVAGGWNLDGHAGSPARLASAHQINRGSAFSPRTQPSHSGRIRSLSRSG